MEKELINEYANSIGIYKNLSEEFLDKLKLTTGCKRFIAEQKIKAISDGLEIDVDFYMLELLNIFDYSDIHEDYVTENEVNSVLPVILEIKNLFKLLPTVGSQRHGRSAYGSAEERLAKYKQKNIDVLHKGLSVGKGLVTSIFSKKGTRAAAKGESVITNPKKAREVKGAFTAPVAGETVKKPVIKHII